MVCVYVFWEKWGAKAILRQFSQPCKQMPHTEKRQLARDEI